MKAFNTLVCSVLVLLAFGPAAVASEGSERDVLLTPDGILYSVETVRDALAEERAHLTITTQEADTRSTTVVPGSLTGGVHQNPALAYDERSRTLFVFWQEARHRGLVSRFLLASLRNGTWSEVTSLDDATWKLRRNLRIAVTRSIDAIGEDGTIEQQPQLIVHAVWWEADGTGDWARYGMLGIDNGAVTSRDFRYLIDFTATEIDRTAPVPESSATGVVSHPAIVANPARDSVDVIFGDARTGLLHRVRLRPVLDLRVRIPIGVRDRNLGRVALNLEGSGRVAAVIEGDTVALYTLTESKLEYVLYRTGAWSTSRSVLLQKDLTGHAAVDALRRAAASQ